MRRELVWWVAGAAVTAGGLSAFAVWRDEQAFCSGDPAPACVGPGMHIHDTASAGLESAAMVVLLAAGLFVVVAVAALTVKGVKRLWSRGRETGS